MYIITGFTEEAAKRPFKIYWQVEGWVEIQVSSCQSTFLLPYPLAQISLIHQNCRRTSGLGVRALGLEFVVVSQTLASYWILTCIFSSKLSSNSLCFICFLWQKKKLKWSNLTDIKSKTAVLSSTYNCWFLLPTGHSLCSHCFAPGLCTRTWECMTDLAYGYS